MVCLAIRGTDFDAGLRVEVVYVGSCPAFHRQPRLLRPGVVRDPEIRSRPTLLSDQTDRAALGPGR